MKEWAIVAMVVFAGGWLVWFGDHHGTNAMRLAAIQAELAETNKSILDFTTKDNQAATEADALRSEGYQKALSEILTGEKCLVTPAMAASFGRITR